MNRVAIQVELDETMNGRVALAPELCCFGKLNSKADAEAIAKALRLFERGWGENAAWYSDGSGKWKKATMALWDVMLERLRDFAARKKPPIFSYQVYCGKDRDKADGAYLELFCVKSDRRFGLRWILPASETTERLRSDVAALVPLLPFEWGYGGLGLHGPESTDATGGKRTAVGDALLAHPLVGPSHPITWGETALGVTNLGWITALGKSFLSRLGGIAEVEKTVRKLGAQTLRTDHALVILASQVATWDQKTEQVMRQLWKLVEPVRPSDDELDESWIPGLTCEEMEAWVQRFRG